MRLLVRCPQCQRTFDATGRPIGNIFRCLCGAVVEIRAPMGREASVVRCSSCGGACQEGVTACLYCKADFTVHDRDLNTVCPACIARVSDRAKFCHHCGARLAVDLQVGAATDHPCPVCGGDVKLSNRQVDPETALLECQRCGGMWLSRAAFVGLAERAQQRAIPNLGHGPTSYGARASAIEQPGPAYRRCVDCDRLMTRQNYGRASGVIIDVCAEHGVWFDAHELDAILHWLAEGGGEKMRAREQRALRDEREAIRAARQRSGRPLLMTPYESTVTKTNLSDALSSIAGLFLK